MKIARSVAGMFVGLVLIAVSWCLGSGAARAQETPETPGTPEVRVESPVTVQVWNRPLVVLRANVWGSSPQDRADRIRAKVESLPVDSASPVIRADATAMRGLEGLLVTVDGNIILGILPQDLDPESLESLDDVGRETVRRLGEILDARRELEHPGLLLRRSGMVAAATGLLLLFGVALLRARRAALRLPAKWSERRLDFHGFDLRAFVHRVANVAVELAVLVAIVASVQSWLAFALSQYPYTRPWGLELRSFLFGVLSDLALGALRAVPGLFTATLILVAARYAARALTGFFDRVERGEIETSWVPAETARATRRIATTLVWIFAITAAYPYLPGSETDAFKGVSVFVGLMVSLGGVGFVNQIMSGLVVVYSRSLKPGDYVRIGDREGVVQEVGALTTKLATRTSEELTVPNAVLVGTTIVNYSRLAAEKGAVIPTTVTIGYDTPWRQVHGLLELAAERTPGVVHDREPVVLQRALSDFYVEYQLLVVIERVEDRFRILSDLHAAIQDAFNEFGVQIMSPHFLAQPAERVVVPRSAWDTPPVGAESRSNEAGAGG
jgi:small-conductance mechanosensitive channel